MPILRLNADDTYARAPSAQIRAEPDDNGPVIVMLHGYKYLPGHPVHCPHRRIFALQPNSNCPRAQSWPRRLGFGTSQAGEGLAVAFGWNARGNLTAVWDRTAAAGHALAHALQPFRAKYSERPIHMISHSMGTEVALQALEHLPAGSIQRVISMTGACYHDRTLAALDSPAGRTSEFINVISRENRLFDWMFERLVPADRAGDRSIGRGLEAANAVTLRIDCKTTLEQLNRIGAPIAAPQASICHWSAYTRPGTLQFYNALLRRPQAFPLAVLQRATRHPAFPVRTSACARRTGTILGQMC
ncbi:MAG: alpha/beta hydrolase [Marinibacterium sp.]